MGKTLWYVLTVSPCVLRCSSSPVGDVVFARLFQKPVIILNSLRAAQDLLEKKGAIYSDRPHMTMHVD